MRYTNLQDTTPRTSAGVLRDVKLALSLGGTFPVNGYFGPSPAVNLPHFNLVWGFTVEYMHAVLLGVVRQITELLLSSSNSQERYYVGKFRNKFGLHLGYNVTLDIYRQMPKLVT